MEHIKMRILRNIASMILVITCMGYNSQTVIAQKREGKVRLTVIDPQHFHAALAQKYVHPDMDTVVHVFAETRAAVFGYQQLIAQYNTRKDEPTSWKIVDYYGQDFLKKAFEPGTGNVVVLAGDNQRKIEYIEQAVRHGRDVFADKPLVIDAVGYRKLRALMDNHKAEESPLVYDMMTERYDVKNQIVKALLNNEVFSGGLPKGKRDDPAILLQSTHYFIKDVSGQPLIRPVLFYNTAKQGEGLVDVTTHYIDLVQWMLSPESVIDVAKDIKLIRAERRATRLSKEQFKRSTGLADFPSVLKKYAIDNEHIEIFCNGKMDYTFKGVPVSIGVQWNAESKDGTGDQFYARFRANRIQIEIRLDETGKAAVFVTPNQEVEGFEKKLKDALTAMRELPGLSIEKVPNSYKIRIPEHLYLSHEEHFAKVLNEFLQYRQAGVLPVWEKSFILAKYYLTTKALEKAKTVR